MATITYEAAMATLQSMFKDTDSGVIAMILQSNGGHMEKTVENLLSMQADMAANAAHDAQQPPQQPSQPQVESHPPMPGAPRRSVSTISRSLDISKPLPDDFLRPPSYFRKTKRSQAQVDQDAYLAQLLQDQEFMADLRRHAQRQGRGGRRQPQQQQLPRQYPGNAPHGQPAAAPAAGPATAPAPASAAPASAEDAEHDHDHPAPEEDAPNFKQRLGKLGDAAKRRLAALAARFSNPRGAAAKPQDSQSYMSLPSLDEEDNKNRPQFTIDDDQTEMVELEDRRFRNKDKTAKPNDDLDDM